MVMLHDDTEVKAELIGSDPPTDVAVLMCTAIASRSGTFAGLGFATPVDLIREVAEALIRDGIVKRGYLGTVMSDDRGRLTWTKLCGCGCKLPTVRHALCPCRCSSKPHVA